MYITAAEIAVAFELGTAPVNGFVIAADKPGTTQRITKASFQKNQAGKKTPSVAAEVYTNATRHKSRVWNPDTAFMVL